MEKPNFKKICFLNMQRLTNFPYIEADFDALTNYELLSKVVEYLNEVIANENEQNETILELYNSFVSLKNYVDNYFDNLDVQDEINHKLDEMVEDGVLEQIIEQYINSTAVFCYDTINDLKSATNLIKGSYVKLLGNTTLNDGACQLFYVDDVTGSEVDGKNDVIVISDSLVAKRVKVKESLELSPNITSNEKISNLKITDTQTSAGNAGIKLDNQENVTIEHNDITGGYWSARIGNENDTYNTVGIKLINNKLTSPHGLSLRHKSGQTVGGEHTLMLNEVNNTSSNPGVESWAKEVQVLFNRITNTSGSVGGTGGITFGNKNNQIAIGNYVKNYNYGIEIGNSDCDIISGNIIENCTRGIVCSSDNTHNVIITNNIVHIKENGYGVYLRSGDKVIISNCIFIYGEPEADYNSSSSRSGYGIYSDTYSKNIEISNCVFINISNVALSVNCNVTNCTFINCRMNATINNQHFSNCIFYNSRMTWGGASGKKVYFNNCHFVRSDDATFNEYMLSGRGNSTPGIGVFDNCSTYNCTIMTLYQNSTTGGSDIRFLSQKIDGIYYTYNQAQLSNVKTAFENMGYSVTRGDKIIDNYNNRIFNVIGGGKQISIMSAVPTSGAFIKGDRIYNNMSSTATVDYWICTQTGEFGTDTEPVFVAKNV